MGHGNDEYYQAIIVKIFNMLVTKKYKLILPMTDKQIVIIIYDEIFKLKQEVVKLKQERKNPMKTFAPVIFIILGLMIAVQNDVISVAVQSVGTMVTLAAYAFYLFIFKRR